MDTSHQPQGPLEPTIHQLNDASSGTYSHVLACPVTRHCAIIDPVLDYNPTTPAISTHSADAILSLIAQHEYTVTRILETHGSSGRKTAAWYLRTQLLNATGAAPRICMGGAVAGVHRMFARQFGVATMGWEKQFDEEFADGETFTVGELEVAVLKLPAREKGHAGYVVCGNVFCGDAFFTPGYRVDDGEMSRGVRRSVRKLCELPEGLRVITAQGGPGRESQSLGKRRLGDHVCTTVGAVRLANEKVLAMSEAGLEEGRQMEENSKAVSKKGVFGLRSRAKEAGSVTDRPDETGGKWFFSKMRWWKPTAANTGEHG